MEAKDKIALANWLGGKASLGDVQSVSCIGIVGNERFTENAKRAFYLAWGWSAPRFHGRFGAWQDRVYAKNGREFVERRIARCNRMIERFLKG